MGRSPQYYVYINSKEWRSHCKKCHALTKHHCVIFPWLKSRNIHHMTYKNFQKERVLRDTVPLSKIAHWVIHLWLLWKTPLRPWVNVVLRMFLLFWAIAWFFVPIKTNHHRRVLLHKKRT